MHKNGIFIPELKNPGYRASKICICMKARAITLTLLMGTIPVHATTDIWDLPPLRYSDTAATDLIARLAEDADESAVNGDTPLEKLQFVLNLLEIPAESQMLVFSKTSKQNGLIHPGNPRALFFNENSYVGYVPGGDIEVITHDDLLGPVFYLIRTGPTEGPRISRDTSDCMSCHGTARTESAPGVLVRSVFPDAAGQPLLSLGTFQIDHTSPIRERWGGYYVTGRSSLPHLGNTTYQDDGKHVVPANSPALESLAGKIDVSRYPRATSDIVALMVLEHQCLIHNHLVAAAMNYRRILWLQRSLDPESADDAGAAGRFADDAAGKIADLLLFANEAELGENGVEGDPAFQDALGKRFPKSDDGRSLADFQLNDRLFKHRCSYMVHSKAFANLPGHLRTTVIARLNSILSSPPSPDCHPDLKPSERRKITTILRETLPGWPQA